ncbi:MAG: autotransporter-associated beta strand repeat-containing protein [Verrucomicrobia bacterium]|nr:autotransporter-associated beta strand repeat-containing protein [Verrucomicrobiota bacterium]
MTASDTNGAATSFNSAGNWSNAQAPGSGNDYFTAGYLLRTPNTGTSNYFAGTSLSLDFNPVNPWLVGLSLKYPSSGSVRVDTLKLNGGAIINGQGGTMKVYGTITVLSNAWLNAGGNGRTLAIYAPVSGGSTNTINVSDTGGTTAGGTVQLLGDNSGYSGNWYIINALGAVLQIGNGGASGSLGSGNVTNNYALMFNRSDNITVNNVISGSGSVLIAGPGRVTLSGANTCSGATVISGGTLALGAGGSLAGSPVISLASGASLDVSAVAGFGLASGQTLAGSGTVIGAVTSVSDATLSPGDTASGTLTVNGDVTLGAGTLRWDLNTPNVTGGTNDLLVVDGNLALGPAITVSVVFPNGIPVPGTYTLCQCTGTLTGDAADLTSNLGTNSASFSLNTAASPKTVTVTVNGSSLPPATNSLQLIKVYLQGGQSNADGRALTNGLPASLFQPQADVPFYYYLTGGAANGDGTLGTLTTLRPGCSATGSTTFGPELSFGRTLANHIALTNQVPASAVLVAIVKYAHGGTSLASNWKANGNSTTNGDGPDYLIFQKVINDGPATSAAYGTNLMRFINDLRLTYATNQPCGTNLPFFLSRISTNQTVYSDPSGTNYPNYLLLRAGQAQVAATVTNVYMIDTDGINFTMNSDHLHFSTGGQQAMGAAFGQAVIGALPAPWLQAPAKSDNSWRLTFGGVSGTAHSLERAPFMAGPWTVLTNIVLGPLGRTSYDDQNAPGTGAFYRVIRP